MISITNGWRGRVVTALTRALLLAALCGVAGTAVAQDTVKFGSAPWPGVTIKTKIASNVLEAAGYKTESTPASWTISLQGVARGDIDADLGIWMPTQKSTVQPLVDSGKVNLLVANVPDAQYDVVVPEYVWEAGVHCICDLADHADKFKNRIYGIEAGNDGNEIMKEAIDNDIYGLGDWNLRPSSTAAMLAQAGRSIKHKDWIVFLGWKPHWMNVKYKLRYLKDPKAVWGTDTAVYTAINPSFAKNNPNVTRFLKQMVVPSKIQSAWIYSYGYKKQSADEVAHQWIQDHMDKVVEWLDGVKTADGSKPAVKAVKAALSS